MPDNILIAVAWPYANGDLHLGHIAGAYLPADIFARFHRMRGNNVLMVSGSDAHGTPITLRAEAEGVSPREIHDRFHQGFLESWEGLGISWDLFTTTETENHYRIAQDFFTRFHEKGLLYETESEVPYSPTQKRYLPDRYINGECPHCDYDSARGDQCDKCGRTLDPRELINPRSSLDGSTPEFRTRSHFMMKFSEYGDSLLEWLKDKNHWRPQVINFTTGFLEQGLKDRAYTRDLDWGIPVPLDGWEDRRIYVWFEAVIGYLSASVEWASEIKGDPEAWRAWWGHDAKPYYFIGKDNITFHTIIWPAMLMAYGDDLALPEDVPANEFLNLEGYQLSTSRNWAVWVPEYLANYDPDALRYVLSSNMPETSDSEFTWPDYIRRVNNELVGTYGNLVHRTLTFLQRFFDGIVPDAQPDEAGTRLLARVDEALEEAAAEISACRFRAGLGVAMGLAQEGNRYLDERAPWRAIREDRDDAARTLVTILGIISGLKTLLAPYLPFSSQRLHEMLGLEGGIQDAGWVATSPQAGTQLPQPQALFAKLDEEQVLAREMANLGAGAENSDTA
ncbi:MAG: methionine--tRNA ligase [Dehalococcoidia bacterium]|nr:methionine--tRNA ligase [Dehalococcoidia bacterium]